MTARKWPRGRTPPPGWEVSPELSEIQGYTVIVRSSEVSRVRRDIRDYKRSNHLTRSGKRNILAGGALMGLGLLNIYTRRRLGLR